ncbi:MAG TPA: CDP-archaeol synthase [Pirellulales bacterium]|jgi:phosphatidate cytidylyltransferase|nr:CDP-archaeol synthase [Pirellulales bacterium]
MLRWRLLLGMALIAILIGLCWLDVHQLPGPPGGWLFPVALLLSLGASDELLRLVGHPDEKPVAWIILIGNLAIVASSGISAFWTDAPYIGSPLERLGWPMAVFIVAVFAAFVGEMARYERQGRVIVRIGLATLCFVYVGLLLSFVVQLRQLGDHRAGMVALVSLIAVVKMGDTGAYTVGRLFGRHKMAPVLSPGKTWEGAVGAVLFAVLAAWIVFRLLPVDRSPATSVLGWGWLIYGIIVGVVGMIGDLAESLIKRDAGCKDSSPWMPGFGGILDVLDSILFAAPVAWILWVCRLV